MHDHEASLWPKGRSTDAWYMLQCSAPPALTSCMVFTLELCWARVNSLEAKPTGYPFAVVKLTGGQPSFSALLSRVQHDIASYSTLLPLGLQLLVCTSCFRHVLSCPLCCEAVVVMQWLNSSCLFSGTSQPTRPACHGMHLYCRFEFFQCGIVSCHAAALVFVLTFAVSHECCHDAVFC